MPLCFSFQKASNTDQKHRLPRGLIEYDNLYYLGFFQPCLGEVKTNVHAYIHWENTYHPVHHREVIPPVFYERISFYGCSHMYSATLLEPLQQEGTEFVLLSAEEILFPNEQRKNPFLV